MTTATLADVFTAAPLAMLNDQAPTGALSIPEIDAQLSSVSRSGKSGIAIGLIYLRHGHLEAAHQLSQDISGQLGDWLHSIMHRLEGDYSNAHYWDRRTGEHALFADIDAAIKASDHDLRSNYSPAALTDAVAGLNGAFDSDRAEEIRAIQGIEIAELFGFLTR